MLEQAARRYGTFAMSACVVICLCFFLVYIPVLARVHELVQDLLLLDVELLQATLNWVYCVNLPLSSRLARSSVYLQPVWQKSPTTISAANE